MSIKLPPEHPNPMHLGPCTELLTVYMHWGRGDLRENGLDIGLGQWCFLLVPYYIFVLKVPFYLSAANDIAVVRSAFNDYHRYTCLRFVPASRSDRNLIAIQNGGGCSSYVGMVGGQQSVSLARGCRIVSNTLVSAVRRHAAVDRGTFQTWFVSGAS
jgi:hypothetical protein